MIERSFFLALVVCFSLTTLTAQHKNPVYVPENPIYVPFGAVHVTEHKNSNALGHHYALEHRFYHALSACEYGTLLLVPNPGGRHGMATTATKTVATKTAATPRGAMHRISFPSQWGESARTGEVQLDLSEGAAGRYGDLLWSHVRIEDDYTVTGAILSEGSQTLGHTYFAVRFSRPIKHYKATGSAESPAYPFMSGRELSVVFTFDLVKGAQSFADDGVLEVRTAFSAVDAHGALQNLETEQESKTFETLIWEMEQLWEKELAVVRIEDRQATGPAAAHKNLFYQSLARSMAWPIIAQDVDKRYRGSDNNIHTAVYHVHYTGLYPASTAAYPLMIWLKPEQSRRFVASALTAHQQSVPNLLPGDAFRQEAVLLLADARAKDILPSSLLPLLTEAITTTVRTPFLSLVQEARKIGFVPAETSSRSVALTREFSYVNWCLIMLASGMGEINTVNEIRPFVTAYQWLLDAEKGMVQPRNRDLSLYFAEDSLNNRDELLYIPHNMTDAVDRAQGRRAYERRLDATDCFPELPYLYVWTASPWKGQELLKELTDACVTASRPREADGSLITTVGSLAATDVSQTATTGGTWAEQIAGSQTATTGGAWAEQIAGSPMAEPVADVADAVGGEGVAGGEVPAAWFVFSSMGLYPLCPGTDQYVLGIPSFKKVVVSLEDGKELVIEAPLLSVRNRYVRSVMWNGKPYDKAYITHRELMQGGILSFTMGSSPARGRTFRGERLPYSYLKK
ncbi:MAG: glycoside hydrolase family 92 protein [Bacteroidales bacterium]|nr:glycoside hydrolase family 92 protein [Bacteroidales bacterium]